MQQTQENYKRMINECLLFVGLWKLIQGWEVFHLYLGRR